MRGGRKEKSPLKRHGIAAIPIGIGVEAKPLLKSMSNFVVEAETLVVG